MKGDPQRLHFTKSGKKGEEVSIYKKMRIHKRTIVIVLVVGAVFLTYFWLPHPSLESGSSDNDRGLLLQNKQLDDQFWKNLLKNRFLDEELKSSEESGSYQTKMLPAPKEYEGGWENTDMPARQTSSTSTSTSETTSTSTSTTSSTSTSTTKPVFETPPGENRHDTVPLANGVIGLNAMKETAERITEPMNDTTYQIRQQRQVEDLDKDAKRQLLLEQEYRQQQQQQQQNQQIQRSGEQQLQKIRQLQQQYIRQQQRRIEEDQQPQDHPLQQQQQIQQRPNPPPPQQQQHQLQQLQEKQMQQRQQMQHLLQQHQAGQSMLEPQRQLSKSSPFHDANHDGFGNINALVKAGFSNNRLVNSNPGRNDDLKEGAGNDVYVDKVTGLVKAKLEPQMDLQEETKQDTSQSGVPANADEADTINYQEQVHAAKDQTETDNIIPQAKAPVTMSRLIKIVPWTRPLGLTGNLSTVSVQTGSGFVQVRYPQSETSTGSEFLQRKGHYNVTCAHALQMALLTDNSLGFIDVGARLGVYSLIAAILQRQILSVEPDPSLYKYLRASVLFNNFEPYVTFLSNAVSYKHKATELNVSSSSDMGSTPLPILTLTLDDLVPLIRFKAAILRLDIDDVGLSLHQATYLFKQVNIPYVFMAWTDQISMLNKLKITEFFFSHRYETTKDTSGKRISVFQSKALPHKFIIWEKTKPLD